MGYLPKACQAGIQLLGRICLSRFIYNQLPLCKKLVVPVALVYQQEKHGLLDLTNPISKLKLLLSIAVSIKYLFKKFFQISIHIYIYKI